MNSREQPLAIEAISILSRLNDFKGYVLDPQIIERMKMIELETPTYPESPVPSELMKAEYQQFCNPVGIFSLDN